MSGQFSQVIAELDKQQEEPNRHPCRDCGNLTLKTMLSHYGGQCTLCYARWCAKPGPRSRFQSNRIADPKDWAKALRAGEESGERLTLFQKQAWRDALRFEMEERNVF